MLNKRLNVGIVGGSISGLMSGIALQSLGHYVTVFEKANNRKGAGLTLTPPSMDYFKKFDINPMFLYSTQTSSIDMDDNLNIINHSDKQRVHTTWDCLFHSLIEKFDNFIYNKNMVNINTLNDGINIEFDDLTSFKCDILIGADGIGSKTRYFINDNNSTDMEYSGYSLWRGVVNCSDINISNIENQILYEFINNYGWVLFHGDNTQFINYIVPNYYDNNDLLYNWGWYVKYNQNELQTILTDKYGNKHQCSIHSGLVNEITLNELTNTSNKLLPKSLCELVKMTKEPFFQVVIDYKCNKMSQIFGEYGGIILTGDAAFTLRPHTTQAVAKAAYNALTLYDLMNEYSQNNLNLNQVFIEYDRIGRINGIELSQKSKQLGESVVLQNQYRDELSKDYIRTN